MSKREMRPYKEEVVTVGVRPGKGEPMTFVRAHRISYNGETYYVRSVRGADGDSWNVVITEKDLLNNSEERLRWATVKAEEVGRSFGLAGEEITSFGNGLEGTPENGNEALGSFGTGGGEYASFGTFGEEEPDSFGVANATGYEDGQEDDFPGFSNGGKRVRMGIGTDSEFLSSMFAELARGGHPGILD